MFSNLLMFLSHIRTAEVPIFPMSPSIELEE
jgi:hypothetical protein